jgi:hypothetical protein
VQYRALTLTPIASARSIGDAMLLKLTDVDVDDIFAYYKRYKSCLQKATEIGMNF